MSSALAAFGRNDLRNVRRDSILTVVVAGPFIYAAVVFMVPRLTAYAMTTYGFDLQPYYPVITGAFQVLGPLMLIGAMCGFLLLEDKDQHTLAALRVTPVPPVTYPLYRAGITVVLTVTSIEATLALSPIFPARLLVAAIPVAAVAGLVAVLIGLLMAAVANNKVEGLAIIRAIGILVFVIPLIPFVLDLDPRAELLFGVLPSYWPAKALWQVMDGGTAWPYLLAGAVYSVALALPLLRRFAR
jgi:fluoroquinolone transport system permease protein